jgi:hypothetical protein
VLIADEADGDAIDRLNAWCLVADAGREQRFGSLDTEAAGGTKVFTPKVLAMAGNYFRWRELAESLPSFGWRFPSAVALCVDAEDVDGYDHTGMHVYRILNGKAVELTQNTTEGAPPLSARNSIAWSDDKS